MSSKQHLAAILTAAGTPLTLVQRPTPAPGPDELLIEVKSIALNPIDWKQRDSGFMIANWPTVLGSDIAGTVISAGSSVPDDAPKPGSRVTAFAPCFYTKGKPDYGALQTRVLVPAANALEIPQGMSFNEASLLPMAVSTAWAGWYSIGLPFDTSYKESDKKGVLIWGGASCVGSATIQTAKLMGFKVYTTASEKNHDYVKSLGADRVFDYESENVVAKIVDAVKADGVTVEIGYDAVGDLASAQAVLKQLNGTKTARLASAPPLTPASPTTEGVESKFVMAPLDPKELQEFFHTVFNGWLKGKIETGEFVPSPRIRVIDGALASVNKALDILKQGVSGEKLVLEV
ncbi:hypothetical protein BC1G_01379 [Paecilomyces variotii No. 5]|uniref:Enoyl reductase (ER) domain-containing protein n=1 Tax=Byssochlamys spectabilis (strain No. 5 / NBRC 109023) TaxID=1356009 RepID=V5I626_BYSSN|nr:hypothetical protein BC1G_01379 [Paecilomyces variotii No. 5]